jgi:hypothetical protein
MGRSAGYTLSDCHVNEEIMRELQNSISNKIHRIHKKLEGTQQQYSKDLKISTKKKNSFGNTSDKMEGFCFVIFVTGLNRSTTGNVDTHKRNKSTAFK